MTTPNQTDQILQQKSVPKTLNASSTANIILAITGGIAAYKSAIFARLLVKSGYHVRVIMTEGAKAFITPLTLQALTGNPVHSSLLDETAEAGMGHIELARWADAVVIAPASANTLARLATGMADDLLTTVCLATTAQVVIAPAMNQQMWAHKAIQNNIISLQEMGYELIEPASGIQACGDTGAGRLPEPEDLFEQLQYTLALQSSLISHHKLIGKKVIITAGATVESIDPVRFLSNHSTGKMGFALATACRDAGADVTLIAGSKVQLATPFAVKRVDVMSANDMLIAAESCAVDADVFIATAAVADYRTKEEAPQKIKKTQDIMALELVKNPDILATISRNFPQLFMVGFAAETQNIEHYAKGKLNKKKLDMIACNDVSRKDIGFASDDNAMTVYFSDKYAAQAVPLTKASKTDIAKQLVVLIGQTMS